MPWKSLNQISGVGGNAALDINGRPCHWWCGTVPDIRFKCLNTGRWIRISIFRGHQWIMSFLYQRMEIEYTHIPVGFNRNHSWVISDLFPLKLSEFVILLIDSIFLVYRDSVPIEVIYNFTFQKLDWYIIHSIIDLVSASETRHLEVLLCPTWLLQQYMNYIHILVA